LSGIPFLSIPGIAALMFKFEVMDGVVKLFGGIQGRSVCEGRETEQRGIQAGEGVGEFDVEGEGD
jgi:hypothetical protein